MDLRRLCNVVYTHMTLGMEQKSVDVIDALLLGDVSDDVAANAGVTIPRTARPAADQDPGIRKLMAAMMMPQKA